MKNREEDYEVDRIFSDKIKLWGRILDYELRLMNEYNNLFRRIKFGELDKEELINDYDYYVVWQQIITLYDFIEHNEKATSKVDKESLYRLKNIVRRYRDEMVVLDFDMLKYSYNLIRQIMDKSGFHDVSFIGKDEDATFEGEEGD